MAEDSYAEEEKLLLRKHELEWENLKARQGLEAVRREGLISLGEITATFGPDPFEVEAAKLKKRQSKELLALVRKRIKASAEAKKKLPDLEPLRIPQTRKEFVQHILDQKGWSILDWANEANVSHVTAAAYLHGKTKTYRSTRMKLAKALGIPVAELPK